MPGKGKHSEKWHQCVEGVRAKGSAEKPEAVCTAALGAASYNKAVMEARLQKAAAAKEAGAMSQMFRLFVPLRKVEEMPSGDLRISGTLIREELDKAGEIFDFESSAPHVKAWSESFEAATKAMGVEPSKGNLRVMHTSKVAGKFTDISFDKELKAIQFEALVTAPDEKDNILKGLYTGVSMGGAYVKSWADPAIPTAKRYTGKPSEGSLADAPCVESARFTIRRADGSEELRKFQPIAKDASAALANAKTAEEAIRAFIAELALLEGEPPTWTLEQMARSLMEVVTARRSMEIALVEEKIEGDAAATDAAPADKTKSPEKAAPPGDLRKDSAAASDAATESALIKTLGEHREGLLKAVVEKIDTAKGELSKRFDGIEERLKTVEATPAAAGSETRPATKSLGSGSNAAAAQTSPADLRKSVDELEAAGALKGQSLIDARKGLATIEVMRAGR